MYSFVDTTAIPGEGSLPSEALKFNGQYLEAVVPGYRTLTVSGREMLAAEVEENEIDAIDGSEYLYRRYPPRDIEVQYQLMASTPAQLMERFNSLNKALSAENAELIFADEPDKYFTGTKTDIDLPEEGKISTKGSFTLHCTDPFKHSSTLKEFTAAANDDGVLEMIIVNDGSAAVPIDYEVTHNAENGFLGIISDSGGVMQFGNIEEADGETYQQNEILATYADFAAAADDHGTEVTHPTYGTAGTLAETTYEGVKLLGYGSKGDTTTSIGGGMRTVTLPADSNGDSDGCKNFYAWSKWFVWAGKMGQTGETTIAFLTADDEQICACNWVKSDKSGNTAYYECWANGKKVKSHMNFTSSHLTSQNPFWFSNGCWDMKKEGAKLTFYCPYWTPKYYTLTIPEVENMKCTKIQFSCKAWNGREDRGGKQISYMHMQESFVFRKLHVDKWKDSPNRFPSGSVATISGNDGRFYLDGLLKLGEENTGTKYFLAKPGSTTVKFYTSSFCTTAPTVKAYIREAYL